MNQRQQIIQAAREMNMMVMPEGGSLFQHNMSMIADGHTVVEHSIPVETMYSDVKQFWSQTETAYTPTTGVGFGGIWGEHYWYAHTNVWEHPKLSKFVPERNFTTACNGANIAPQNHYNHFNIARGFSRTSARRHLMVTSGAHGQRERFGPTLGRYLDDGAGGRSPLQASHYYH